jgi:hypothetical protein
MHTLPQFSPPSTTHKITNVRIDVGYLPCSEVMTTGTVSPVSALGSPAHVTSKPKLVTLRLCSQSNPVERTSAPFSNASLSSPTTTESKDFLSTLTTVARIALFTSFVRSICRRRSHRSRCHPTPSRFYSITSANAGRALQSTRRLPDAISAFRTSDRRQRLTSQVEMIRIPPQGLP